jgi:predicted outer membrane repeat protein
VDKVRSRANFRNNSATQNGGGLYFIETPPSPPRATFNVVSVTNNTFVGTGGRRQLGGGSGARPGRHRRPQRLQQHLSGKTAGKGAAADMAIDADGTGK